MMNLLNKLCLLAILPLSCLIATQVTTVESAKVSIVSKARDTTYTTTALFNADIKPQLISKQFLFTEGPSADKNGNVYFTDQPNNAIWKYSTVGNLTLFSNSAGGSNGTYFDKAGSLITCADGDNQLWRFSKDGKKTTIILNDFDGHRFNGPNDLWIDSKGGIFFTDPYYQRPYWTRTTTELDGQKVYYLPKGSKQATIAATNFERPNGIAGTRDGKYLYVADIKADKTYKYEVEPGGKLTNRQLFTNKGSDGMTLDELGNVYLTGSKGVYIYRPDGQQIGLIAIAEPHTANVGFSGKNCDVLFITSSTAIYTLKMNVRGSNKNASKQR